MKDQKTEPLTLEISGGVGHLSMRGKTVIVVPRQSFQCLVPWGLGQGCVTLNGIIETGSVSWPLLPLEAGQVWNELFKEAPDARN